MSGSHGVVLLAVVTSGEIGRALDDADACTRQMRLGAFISSGGSLRGLVRDVTATDAFIRVHAPRPAGRVRRVA